MAGSLPVDLGVAGSITAVLGPTNTGKTHHAIERMLQHRSGMIGLPLRLLAREVYDRVVALRGEAEVALVTGEERRIPLQPRFWICTTEAMPVDRPVAFLAVDEIQLAADRHRGHAFTERLLHARGVAETWFMGADTMGPILQQLVPTAQIRSRPRLSRLRYAGHRKLTSLPARSAVVAFSAQQVFSLADRLRAQHGGVAVITGALSPAARNAQVAMFEAGEVAHLVATDAIGMGLNMDVHHVALAAREKFDGHEHRPLRPEEVAQIAGRAGRFLRDGTFGTTDQALGLDEALIDAVEQHQFLPVRRLRWRNPVLDFSTPEALALSLDLPARHGALVPVRDATDRQTLDRLIGQGRVQALARGEAAVRRLWEVASVPDFGNVLPEHHADMLGQLYVQLVERGEIDTTWVEREVRRLDRPDGEVGLLMARISGLRLWSYLAHRTGWISDPSWRGRIAEVEGRLSDALHQRLTARFVDRRASVLVRADGGDATLTVLAGGAVQVDGQPVGRLVGFSLQTDRTLPASTSVGRALRRALRAPVADRVEALVAAPDGALSWGDDGSVCWDGDRIAVVAPGSSLAAPRLRSLRHDLLEPVERDAVAARLDRWWRNTLDAQRQPPALFAPNPHERAILAWLEAGPGAVERATVASSLAALGAAGQGRLREAGVYLGTKVVLWPERLAAVRWRAMLWRVARGEDAALPDDNGRTPHTLPWSPELSAWLGFFVADRFRVRADVLDVLLAGGEPVATALGVTDVPALLRALPRARMPR